MDLVSLYFSVCVMMVCLPRPAQVSSIDENCPCPQIPQWSLTKPPPTTCFHIGKGFRYECIDGYLRKAGTSNLIKCEATGGPPRWSESTLKCIPDPKITRTTSTTTSTTTTTTATTTATATQQTMTTGKTTFTAQIMQSTSSAPEEGNLTETTTHEIVTQKAGKTKTTKHSTPSPRVANKSISPSISQTEPQKTTTVATVSTLILVIICSLGIIFLLYRRKSNRKHDAVPTEDEQP